MRISLFSSRAPKLALVLTLLATLAGGALSARAADPAEIRIGYLRLVESKQQPISLIDEPNDDDGHRRRASRRSTTTTAPDVSPISISRSRICA